MEIVKKQGSLWVSNTIGITRQLGFSLIELVIVIVLISIVATYASLRSPGAVNLNAQAQQLVTAIQYTQMLAMTKGQRYRLTITPSTSSYAISSTAGVAVNDLITNNATTTLGSGISFGAISGLSSTAPYYVAFDGRGTPYSDAAATTPLTSTATITLSSNNQTRQVQITPAGQVAVP